jgi:sigma-B regulation protein RsbU (phosphoserine phosphatase)
MTASAQLHRILLVDDELNVLNGLRRSLSRESYEITATTSPDDALRLLASQAFTVVITDQQMPRMPGVKLLEHAKTISPHTVRLILTGHADTQSLMDAINRGAVHRFLTKPCRDDELQQALRQSIQHFELRRENRQLQELTQRQLEDLRRLNAELIESRRRDATIGAGIQQTLLEGKIDPPLTEEWDAAALTVPSQQIDGDFFDFFEHGPTCFDLVVGDVMGKGIPAALLGAAAKTQLVRAMAALKGAGLPEPEEIVTQVHKLITHQLLELESFVTLCYARFDLARQQLSFVDCGHTRILHYRSTAGDCAALQGVNLPLGFSASEEYRQCTLSFGPGDRFLFYSDGVTEARNQAGECYGEERLSKLLCRLADRAPHQMIELLRTEVASFAAAETLTDDLTCVGVAIGTLAKPIVFEGRMDELERVRKLVFDFTAGEWGERLDEVLLDQLVLAANEVYANIVKHVHHGGRGEIAVSTYAEGNAAVIRFSYRGQVFDPSSADEPAFDGSRSGGFGLYIARNCVDQVDYDGHGNCRSITLRKVLQKNGGS